MLEFFMQLVQQWGYLGVFVATLIGAAVFILPTPAFLVVFVLAAPQFGLDPLLLGLVGGFGASIGEMTSWIIGRTSHHVFLKKYKKKFHDIGKAFQRYHPSLVIFAFSALPLPIDVIGLFCGMVHYPWQKFYIPTLAGKLVKYLFLAYAGYYGIGWVKQALGA